MWQIWTTRGKLLAAGPAYLLDLQLGEEDGTLDVGPRRRHALARRLVGPRVESGVRRLPRDLGAAGGECGTLVGNAGIDGGG
jgi:hypothetical protein